MLSFESQMLAQSGQMGLDNEPENFARELERGAFVAPDKLESESIASNLEASLRVFTEQHFFSWTQGSLQSLIQHDVLFCILRRGEAELFDVESFSTSPSEPEPFSVLYRQDLSLSDGLVKEWKVRQYQPFIHDIGDDKTFSGSLLQRELRRLGTSKLIGHGTHDANGLARSFFVFACKPDDAGPRSLKLIEMLVPFLHAAWIRTKINLSGCGDVNNGPGLDRDILTVREQEVLSWVYLGKSNIEIGLILGISPLTVKNHVQEILHRLNVQNRAQAVGKAFMLHILSC
jgi:transcriptional regulator EpsA